MGDFSPDPKDHPLETPTTEGASRSTRRNGILLALGGTLVLGSQWLPWRTVSMDLSGLKVLAGQLSGIPAHGSASGWKDSATSMATAAAATTLLALGLFLTASGRASRALAVLALAGAVVILCLTGATWATLSSRADTAAGSAFDATASQIDVSPEVLARTRTAVLSAYDVAPGPGIFVAMAGGALGLLGAVLATRARPSQTDTYSGRRRTEAP